MPKFCEEGGHKQGWVIRSSGPYSFWVKSEWAGFGPEVGVDVSGMNGCNGSTVVTVDGACSPNRYIQREQFVYK